MDPSITNLYVQLVGVGVLWVTIHCGGMCGPIVAGLCAQGCRQAPAGSSRLGRLAPRVKGVLAYQCGRLVTYVALGALAGGVGASVDASMRHVTKITALLVAAAMIGAGMWQLRASGEPGAEVFAGVGKRLGGWMRRVMRVMPKPGLGRMALFGLVMGLLPCMLMFWVVSLAVASASMIHGALLMGGLVVLTTPVLLLAGSASALLGPRVRRLGQRFVPLAVAGSGVRIGLVGLAANGWIKHVHVPFEVFGERYTFMLW
ncbi:MAG: sulfite exporter TauE/SafE family protein [Myxococcota bacterium]